jgi:hypothetical protein
MRSTKTIIILVVLIILAIIGWLWYGASTTTAPNPEQSTASATDAADISDAALQRDLNAVDADLKNLDTDTASVDQSLSTQ